MEVLVASAIVGILLVAVLSGLSFGFTLMRKGRENHRATQIMLAKLEQIRLFTWQQVVNGLPTTFVEPFDPTTNGGSVGFYYTGTVAVASAPISASYSNFMRQITITLNWAPGKTVNSQSISTLMASNAMLYVN